MFWFNHTLLKLAFLLLFEKLLKIDDLHCILSENLKVSKLIPLKGECLSNQPGCGDQRSPPSVELSPTIIKGCLLTGGSQLSSAIL